MKAHTDRCMDADNEGITALFTGTHCDDRYIFCSAVKIVEMGR